MNTPPRAPAPDLFSARLLPGGLLPAERFAFEPGLVYPFDFDFDFGSDTEVLPRFALLPALRLSKGNAA